MYVSLAIKLYAKWYDKSFFYYSLSFLLVCMFYVWFSPFAMIMNLLMRADARTPRGQQGNGDSAA